MAQLHPNKSAIAILPIEANSREVGEMVKVNQAAFASDPFLDFCLNRPGVADVPIEQEVATHLERMNESHYVYRKAVYKNNPTGRILGTVVWYFGEDPQNEKVNTPWGDWPGNAHIECLDAVLRPLRQWRLEHFSNPPQPYLYLAELTILPEFQRQGIGSLLVRDGLKEGDRRGLSCFLEASPAGASLYRKFGWEEVKTSKVNLADFGGDNIVINGVAFIRPPGAKELKVDPQ